MACIVKRRNRWVIDFYDNQGKRQRKTLPMGITKTKAKESLREIENQLAKGSYIPDIKIPLFKKVAEDWLEFKKPNIRGSTWSMYDGHLRKHFNDVDNLKVNRITVARVEKHISDRQKSGMNITTLRKIIVTFNQVMNYAVRHKYINHNPVRDAERPRGQGKEDEPTTHVLTPEQINSFLSQAKVQKFRVLFKLAIMSGARQGELLGLKWSDFDWFNKQVRIKRTFNNGAWRTTELPLFQFRYHRRPQVYFPF